MSSLNPKLETLDTASGDIDLVDRYLFHFRPQSAAFAQSVTRCELTRLNRGGRIHAAIFGKSQIKTAAGVITPVRHDLAALGTSLRCRLAHPLMRGTLYSENRLWMERVLRAIGIVMASMDTGAFHGHQASHVLLIGLQPLHRNQACHMMCRIILG